jgi:glucose/arabinose dehydrogenase
VGVTVARDGSLLVSDDGANRIWKISAGGTGTR